MWKKCECLNNSQLHNIIFLELEGLAAAVYSQDKCPTASCHPQLGDLMVGRGGRLSATSTCGLDGPQNYCIIGHLEDEKKCFSCDSRQPYNRYTNPRSHRIENVITTFDPERRMKWWQSENGVHEVSIQLDLETVFQFSHLVLTFKSFRPSAMLVERSKDNGRTWTVFRYFAEDCGSSFPGVPVGAGSSVGDVVCDTRYSGAEPSTGGEVVLKALDPTFQINDLYSPEIQELITMTNLRVNFTRLLTLGDTLLGRRRRNPQDKYYYALYEMVVRGTCFCNGHASQCVPVDSPRGDVVAEPGMVHGRCVCQHNTAGSNCERCRDLYNDSPWRPAGHSDPHPCKKCNCNGHSERCHFDMARYISTGEVSGGVCDECGNNRVGVHCERCRPFYYRDPRRVQNDPDACVPCDCDPVGSLVGGPCDPGTGHCVCKRHVEGDRCDRCRHGFYGLSRENPDGCTACRCNPLGSVETPYPCDPVTGQCFCKPFATGPMCDRCVSGYWGLGNTVHSCLQCDCDIGGSQDSRCNPLDGQCPCRPNIVGPRCKDPALGYFLAPLDFYLYEAELAAPLQGSAQSLVGGVHPNQDSNPKPTREQDLTKPAVPPCQPAPQVNPTGLPRCEQFFRDRGYDFQFRDGKFVLTKRRVRKRRQEQTSIPLYPGSPLQIIPRQRIPGQPVTWTGPGFVRVQHGAGLRFTVNNLPVALDYYLVLRYEPESSDTWTAKVKVIPRTSTAKRRCANDPADTAVTLPGSSRMALLETPICLEDDALYYVDTIFEKQGNLDPKHSSHILIDSMGLIPRMESLPSFCSETKLEEFERYRCLEVASQLGPRILPEVCKDLIVSMSALIHNGAVACRCNLIGSYSQSCSKFGGQCNCKPNVISRCCDTCAPNTFGFGPNGCKPCNCDPRGSFLEMCDQASGQCACRPEVSGQRCDRCRPGYFGFPLCRPCQCNGLADLCDPVSGACVDCRDHAAGPHCDRCVDGYYSNLALGEPCQPCLCPDTKASGRFFARSCSKDPNSLHVLCHCEPGHSGPRCDVCSSGFYGNLALPEARCQECQCNNNTDPQDRDSCDPVTGTCLRCLHHTYGSACESCEPGYYGNALAHNCRECRCDPRGTEINMCSPGGSCLCQQSSGQCPCQPGVAGISCDECQQGFWGFASEAGCQPCDCHPSQSLSDQCDKVTGQCPCHLEFGGRHCDECGENFFQTPDLQCISCDCNVDGTARPSCDHHTGECLCRPGVAGSLCSECAPGHGPPFPDCAICHDCWNLWAENVTMLQGQVERISAVVKQQDPQLHPSYSPWLNKLDMTEKLYEQIKYGCLSLPSLQIETFRDAIDPHIIFDTSPLLNTHIDNIRNEFHKLLGKLEKVKPNEYGDLKALRKIRKYHAEVKEAEEQCKDAKAMLAASRQKRKEAKDKLDSRLVEDWDALERKVKALNVTNLYEEVSMNPLDSRTPKTFLLYLQIQEAKKKSQDTKSKAEELKKKIDRNLEKFEREKNNTKDLIKQVKDFLTDEMVKPEDIEMVATAVLAIQLPSSPEEIRDLINKIRSILVNSTKLLEDLERLREDARTAQDLLQRAKEVQNKTRSIDVSRIKKALKDAEDIQDNVSRNDANLDLILKNTSQMNAKLNDTETVLNVSRIKDLVEQVEVLKNKTEMNRLQGQEAKAAADLALKNATLLDEVNTLFQELEKKKDNGTKELVDERLKNIMMEAENIAKEVKDKMTQIEDLETKIVQLLRVKNEKAVEVDELLQKADDIRKELTDRAVAYAKC
uniref:Laminin, beta 4 n=1 Tax=Scleropages formosus TaxID=113540 RepID=A0A8C9RVZ6_SCLFO